jgi:diguanylate cyclase (GGDEF)-like protein
MEVAMQDGMVPIIEQCLRLDNYASRIYRMLEANAGSEHLERLWKKVAESNEEHVFYWNQLCSWAGGGLVGDLFEAPDQVLAELQALDAKVKELAGRCEGIHEKEKAFALAFKLEFYLLHPAYETLFQYYQVVQSEENDAVRYDRHINTLFDALYKNDLVTLELELVGETIHRLWQENRKMAVLSNTDELTGILNRRGLFNTMNHLGHLAQRNQNAVGVLMIDIDHFKKINDAHGHQKGDAVLRAVAGIIKSNVRASDALGRYGGEEFLVFLTMVEEKALVAVGEKIRKAVAADGRQPAVTISVGGAFDHIDQNVEQGIQNLIQLADKNLLLAKRSGRNKVCV